MDNLAFIRLTNWSYALGGEHFSVSMRCGSDYVQPVEYPLSAWQAKELNKKDDVTFYEKGMLNNRFFTRDDAIETAVEEARKRWPHIKAVIDNDNGQPHEVFWCADDKVWTLLTRCYARVEEMYNVTDDPWSWFPDEMDFVCATWDKLLEELIK